MSEAVSERVGVLVEKSDLDAVHGKGLTAEQALHIVATTDYSDEILREARGDE